MSPEAMEQVAALEGRVIAADGGRLKLEWGVLNRRSGEYAEDLLWRETDRVSGFVGIYAFGGAAVELAGMVDPVSRRTGIATRLLDAALPLCAERGYDRALLVTPRPSAAGRAFALSRGARLEHSEHALVLRTAPSDGPSDPLTTLRPATGADVEDVSAQLAAAFGSAPPDVADNLSSPTDQTLVVEREGRVIGTARVSRGPDTGGIYGFAIDPAWRGRGIGGDVLRRMCRLLLDEGAREVGLEVAVDNDRALGLYTSTGFTEVTTEDYYELPTGLSRPG